VGDCAVLTIGASRLRTSSSLAARTLLPSNSIEVEEELYKHPAVQAAAVVASLGKYLRSGHVDCRGS
jgi:hypothetical protein